MRTVTILILIFISSCERHDKNSYADLKVTNSLKTFVDFSAEQNKSLLQEIKEKTKNAGRPQDYQDLEAKAQRLIVFQDRILIDKFDSKDRDSLKSLIGLCKKCQIGLLDSLYADKVDSTQILVDHSKLLILVNQALIGITDSMFHCDWKSYPDHKVIQYHNK